jgi:hypothetical protein
MTVFLRCCSSCFGSPDLPGPDDPFALTNLLPAGVIQVGIPRPHDLCSHFHAEGVWHYFQADAVLSQLENYQPDYSVVQRLSFLIKHSFVVATCRLTNLSSVLCIRIYVVPYDLAGVQGKLRIRDHATLLKARPLLRSLLQQTLQDPRLWEGHDSPPNKTSRPVLFNEIVRTS